MKTLLPAALGNRLEITRRRFMGIGAALAGGALSERAFSASEALASTAAQAAQAPQAPPNAWKKLKRNLSGQLVRHGQFGYTRLSMPNNVRYRGIKPAGVAVCATAEDVATCLKWCQQENMPLAIRGGGHFYAGYSCTRGLLINLSSLNDASYDETSGRITIGGGTLNGAVYTALGGIGRSITHGRCTTVGAGGYLLGGGIGFEMRAHGIGSDKLVSTEIVTADGSILTANASDYSDLFWACRGGAGGNFGINTAFTLETFPIDRITVFDLTWMDASDELITAVIRALEAAPHGLGSKVYMEPYTSTKFGSPPEILLRIYGQFHGTEAELTEIIAPMTANTKAASETIESLPYWEGQYFLAEEGTPACYQSRSRFVNGSLPEAFIEEIRLWMSRWESSQGGAYLSLFQTGGAVNEYPSDASAFVHRDSQWLFDLGIGWDRTQSPQSKHRAHRWQNGFHAALTPIAGGGAFQNFPDPSLKDWEDAYYGSNLSRLRRVKTKYDPNDLFRFPQSIRP
ncbi:FAD-binding oxidoreductase [Methylococcus mesophilus]|uniref:FAD-binding oxidoreductase n=1 Tax=Methylococcus mesophilus TaxID=2993564 RepID=UPI00224AFDB0|nr:FAD-binding oxidoreductase [Methylococcus mesophilus]UZR29653.1 FAD-binding oxidoreductase [Methylococcus mesophilus]